MNDDFEILADPGGGGRIAFVAPSVTIAPADWLPMLDCDL